jgi:hypothetical protein
MSRENDVGDLTRFLERQIGMFFVRLAISFGHLAKPIRLRTSANKVIMGRNQALEITLESLKVHRMVHKLRPAFSLGNESVLSNRLSYPRGHVCWRLVERSNHKPLWPSFPCEEIE